MATTIEKTFQVDEPIDKVWDYLSDPSRIVTCVPGASLTEKVDESNYKGEVTMKFGPIKAKYNGLMTFEEMNKETRKMVLKGKGVDDKGTGSADMLLNGNLVEKDGGTEVNYSMEITITGKLAQFGSRLITDVSNQVFNTFVDNFKAKLAGEEVDNSMDAASMMGAVVKSKLGGFFGKKS